MSGSREFYVYMMSNVSKTLYIGVTSDLLRRVTEHRTKKAEGFSKHYNTTMLVYMEQFNSPSEAIAREKQLKRWNREKKTWLIERENPEWRDLAHSWFGPETLEDEDLS